MMANLLQYSQRFNALFQFNVYVSLFFNIRVIKPARYMTTSQYLKATDLQRRAVVKKCVTVKFLTKQNYVRTFRRHHNISVTRKRPIFIVTRTILRCYKYFVSVDDTHELTSYDSTLWGHCQRNMEPKILWSVVQHKIFHNHNIHIR